MNVIEVKNVTQRFRVIHERPDTLRELFSRFLRQKVNYHDYEAVNDVSFNVQSGEMFGILGRNGSGKSTLLKVIAGVYRPTSGSVKVHGTIAPLLELGAGMHSELTGRENILLNGLLMGFSKQQMTEREQRIIEFAEIGDFIDVPIKQYSSGMYTRLAFSVASEVDPDVLVLDEILAVGDMSFQQKCFARMDAFRKSGKTIILVSHDARTMAELCDRALLLDHGRATYLGNAKDAVLVYKESLHLSTETREFVGTASS